MKYNLVLDRNIYQIKYLLSLEMIWEAVDNGQFGCGIIDLQKAFDTVDNHILLKKLDYYRVEGRSNDWFNFISYKSTTICL